nr:hypothetical protein [uncultured Desulfobulbus sp.]
MVGFGTGKTTTPVPAKGDWLIICACTRTMEGIPRSSCSILNDEYQMSCFLEFPSEGKREEKENGLPHGLLFSLFQMISEDEALQYQVGFFPRRGPVTR